MRHKLCRSFHPWCPGVKNRCLLPFVRGVASALEQSLPTLSLHLRVGYLPPPRQICAPSTHPRIASSEEVSPRVWELTHLRIIRPDPDQIQGATGLRLISLTVMQSLNVVFHVGLNKLLTKPAYDVTVMDDLALGGASLLSAHYVPVYLKQSCWHKFVDAAKTDRIKEVRYQICICVYNNCWCDVLTVFSKRDKLEIGGVNPLETC